MIRKCFLALLFLSLFLLSLSAKPVKVGYYRDSGNFMSGFSADDPHFGYAYEYIQTLAAYAGWECEYVYGEWNMLYPALLSGEIDVLPDVSRIPEREHLLLYPRNTMGQETYYLYSNERNLNISLTDYSTWHGKKIAVNTDYYYYNLFMEWQKDKNLGCEIVRFSGDDQYYDLFEKHEFDLLLEIDMVANSDWNPLVRIGSSDFYLAVTKGRADLVSDVNAAMAKVLAMNPYYNAKLWMQYFADTTVSKSVAPHEDEWLSEHPVINVGCMSGDLPFAAYNEVTGTAEGLIEELFSYFSDNLINEKSTFSYIFYDDTELMFSDLRNGIIDVIAPVYRDLNFAEDMGFIISEKLSSMKVGYACRAETVASAEPMKKIAIPKRLRMPFYIKKNYSNADVVLYDTYEACLEAVLSGEVDGAVFNIYKMRGFQNKNKQFRKLTVIELPASCELAFLFSRENSEFFSLVNKLLMAFPSENISSALDTYLIKEQGYTKENFFTEYFLFISLSVIAFIAIFISLVFALRRIRDDMYFDSLTHLRNRRSLNSFISKFFHHASSRNEKFSLILFDLDNFKYLNDTYGHDFGDEVLVTAASVIKNSVRSTDKVFRWGGEEFLILFKGDLSAAKDIAERVRKEIEKLAMKHEYETVHFTATVGVASYEKGVSYMDLFRRVDANLYKGKNSGKNQVVG